DCINGFTVFYVKFIELFQFQTYFYVKKMYISILANVILINKTNMKKTIYYLRNALLAFSFITFTTFIWAQNEYITVWKTDNPGASNNTEFALPAAGEYSYSLDQIVNGVPSGSPTVGTATDAHTFTVAVADTYLLKITPSGTTPFHQ